VGSKRGATLRVGEERGAAVAKRLLLNPEKASGEIANPLVFHAGEVFLRRFSGERDSPPASAPAMHPAGRGRR